METQESIPGSEVALKPPMFCAKKYPGVYGISPVQQRLLGVAVFGESSNGRRIAQKCTLRPTRPCRQTFQEWIALTGSNQHNPTARQPDSHTHPPRYQTLKHRAKGPATDAWLGVVGQLASYRQTGSADDRTWKAAFTSSPKTPPANPPPPPAGGATCSLEGALRRLTLKRQWWPFLVIQPLIPPPMGCGARLVAELKKTVPLASRFGRSSNDSNPEFGSHGLLLVQTNH